MQVLEFDASCESPLLLGDHFGRLEVVGFAMGPIGVSSCPIATAAGATSTQWGARNSNDTGGTPALGGSGCELASDLLPDCDACASAETRLAKIRLEYIDPAIYAGPRHVVGRVRATDPSFADRPAEDAEDGAAAEQAAPAASTPSRALLVHSAGHVIASVDAIESGETVLIPIARRFSNQDTVMVTLVNTGIPACAINDLITLTVAGCIAAHAAIPIRCHGAPTTEDDGHTAIPRSRTEQVSTIEIGDEFANGLFRIHGFSTRASDTRVAVDALTCPCRQVSSRAVCGPGVPVTARPRPATLTFAYRGELCHDDFGQRLHLCNQQYGLGGNRTSWVGVAAMARSVVEVEVVTALGARNVAVAARHRGVTVGDEIAVSDLTESLTLVVKLAGVVVSSVSLDTSCDSPLFLGDRFGAFELVGADSMSLSNRAIHPPAGTDNNGTEFMDRSATTGEASLWDSVSWTVLVVIAALVLIGSVACHVYITPRSAPRKAEANATNVIYDQADDTAEQTKLRMTMSGRPLPSEPAMSATSYVSFPKVQQHA